MADPTEPQTLTTLVVRSQVVIDYANREISVDGHTYAWPPIGEPEMATMSSRSWPLPIPIVVNVGARLPKAAPRA